MPNLNDLFDQVIIKSIQKRLAQEITENPNVTTFQRDYDIALQTAMSNFQKALANDQFVRYSPRYKDSYSYQRSRLANQIYKLNQSTGNHVSVSDILGAPSQDRDVRAASAELMSGIKSIRSLYESLIAEQQRIENQPDYGDMIRERDLMVDNLVDYKRSLRGPGVSITKQIYETLERSFGYDTAANALYRAIKDSGYDDIVDVDFYSLVDTNNLLIRMIDNLDLPDEETAQWKSYVGDELNDYVQDIKIWQ